VVALAPATPIARGEVWGQVGRDRLARCGGWLSAVFSL
jgi:hypothetical protein